MQVVSGVMPCRLQSRANMSGVIKQNIFIRLDDPDSFVLEMFLQPISFHQRLRMRVLRRMGSHRVRNFRLLLRWSKGIYNFIAYAPASNVHLASDVLEFRVAHSSRVRATASRRRRLFLRFPIPNRSIASGKACFGETPKVRAGRALTCETPIRLSLRAGNALPRTPQPLR